MNQTSRVACDMSTAPDTPQQRAAEYRRLFTEALCGRDQTAQLVRFRFRADPVVDAQVRSLAAREQACCPFFRITLSAVGDQLWWETQVDDTTEAKAMLAEFARLPDQRPGAAGSMVDSMIDRGLITADPNRS